MIFSNNKRTFMGPAEYGESQYEYLERSARTGAQKIRAVMEDWFSRYPESEKNELKARLKTSNDISFLSALYELYLHELLLCLGYSIKVHPQLEGTDKRPDFLITDSEGYSSYVEAALVTGSNNEEQAAEKRTNALLDAINGLKSPNFFLGIDTEGFPRNSLSGKRLKRDLETWLDKLDVDKVVEDTNNQGYEALPKHYYRQDGLKVEFTALPKSPEYRGKQETRAIGLLSSEPQWSQPWRPIRDSVKAKGNHYGTLDRPLIVAINEDGIFSQPDDALDALFGQLAFQPMGPGKKPRVSRKLNGIWLGPTGIQYRRISGVLMAPDIRPWTLAARNLKLYHNPWATHAIHGPICKLNQVKIDEKNKKIFNTDGVPPREIFGLNEGWPENKLKKIES